MEGHREQSMEQSSQDPPPPWRSTPLAEAYVVVYELRWLWASLSPVASLMFSAFLVHGGSSFDGGPAYGPAVGYVVSVWVVLAVVAAGAFALYMYLPLLICGPGWDEETGTMPSEDADVVSSESKDATKTTGPTENPDHRLCRGILAGLTVTTALVVWLVLAFYISRNFLERNCPKGCFGPGGLLAMQSTLGGLIMSLGFLGYGLAVSRMPRPEIYERSSVIRARRLLFAKFREYVPL